MNHSSSPTVVFLVASAFSGFCSGIAAAIPPLGLFFPEIFFGIALTVAIDRSISPLSTGQRTAIISFSIIGYFMAIASSLVSMRIPGVDNSLHEAACAGAIGGGVGALVIASVLVCVVQELRKDATILCVTIAGAVLGGTSLVVSVSINDYTSFGHPYSDLVLFSLWQIGVAIVIPLFCRRSNMQVM